MLSVLVAALLAQAPADLGPRTVAVLATSKRPGVDQYIEALTGRVHALLARENVGPLLEQAAAIAQLRLSGVSDPRTCQGGRACVARMAVILGARTVVVGVDVGKAGRSLAVIMEAVAADTGLPLLTSEFEVPLATYSDASALPVTLFARELKKKLDAERPREPEVAVRKPVEDRPVVDTPIAAKLEPQATPPPAISAPAPVGSGARRAVGWTSTAAAFIAAGAGVGLGWVGLSAKDQITASLIPGRTPPASLLTQSQLKSLEGQANGAFTGALISSVVAGVLGLVAIYCFASGA